MEIICKMAVVEHNIDLLLSTGPWFRIEEFIRILCELVTEDPPIRYQLMGNK